MLQSRSDKTRITALLGLASILTLFNIYCSIHHGQNTGCVDPYWADFWLISYTDGYERRALIGQVMRLLFSGSVSYSALNAITFAVAVCALSAVYGLFFSRISGNRLWPLIFLVMVSGPASAVFFETLGDPLQVALLCALACIFIIDKIPPPLRGILALVAAILTTLIHEASIFLILPFLYMAYALSMERKPDYRVMAALMAVLVVCVVVFLNKQGSSAQGLALATKDGTVYYHAKNNLPPFSDLLNDELKTYFGSAIGPAKLITRIGGALLVPLLVLLGISHATNSASSFRIFLCLLAPSLPMYVIAHDWGRFVIYTFCLTVALYGKFGPGLNLAPPRFAASLAEKAVQWSGPLFAGGVGLLLPLLIFQPHPSYRIIGLTRPSLFVGLTALAAFALACRLNRPADVKSGG